MTAPAPPQPRVLIRGFGLLTPLAHSAWETFSALLAGKTLASRVDRLPPDTDSVDLVRALGCVSVAQYTTSDPSVELADRAAREALQMAGVTDAGSMPTYLGVSKGAVAALTAAAGKHLGGLSAALGQKVPSAVPPEAEVEAAVALGPVGYLAVHLRRRLALGPLDTTIAACSSSLTALHRARRDLLHAPSDNPRRLALVLTSEAALYPLFIHSYARLGVLPPLSTEAYRGRPLDRHRQGFMLAELAAAVVLERLEADEPVPPGSIELLDTAVAAEGHDLIRPAPGMPALQRVAERLFRGRSVHMIHPHATGTPGDPDHDAQELAVYHRALGPDALAESTPDFYASKGALGHGLGAAGLVSLVLACVCAKARQRPPMPWLHDPIASPLPLHRDSRNAAQTHAVFAAGFGGHVAGAVITRV